tara:strand:+ start:684 stop:3473 length:2790 start_codon:yes stop_codon:yes gene_type:complete
MAGPFNIAIKAVLKQLGKGSARAVPEDIMSGTIRRIKQEAQLPETPSRVLGKDPERYTGPHSDFKRKEGLESVEKKEGLEALEKLENYNKEWKDLNRLSKSQRQQQSPKVKEAAEQFEKGILTGKEFRAITKAELPIKSIDEMIDVPQFKEIVGALKPEQVKKGIVGLTEKATKKVIEAGQRVATRLDIPAYDFYNKWIVSIHKGLKGAPIGYGKSARLTNVVFGSEPRTALDIAQKKLKPDATKIRAAKKAFEKKHGRIPNKKESDKIRKDPKNLKAQTKATIARMEGDWGKPNAKKIRAAKEAFEKKHGRKLNKEESDKIGKDPKNFSTVSDKDNRNFAERLLENKKNGKYIDEAGEEWIQVGMNPYRASYFYNKATGQALQAADEVIQVGPLVFARGARRPTLSEYKKGFTVQTEKGRKVFKQGGQVSEGLSSIVSRAKGGKTKRKKKDKDFYADFDRKGKPTPELSNRIAISRLMEDLEWERINKEVKRKRREEAEQWEDMKFIQEAMKEDKKGTQMFMPNQDLYKNPIFKDVVTKRKDGGGLSNIKKSININGQPHSLAWINPGEASALKAMGGSGKKGPMGIPSYQTTDEDYSWDWGDTGGYDYGAGKTEADIAADPGRDVSVLGETGYSDEELRDYAAGLGTTVRGLGPIGTERAKAEHHDTLTDMRKGILGLYGDRMTRGEALEGAKRSAFTAWRNSIGKYSRDTAKDYDAWFAKQDPNALIAGYKIGDPVGQAMQSSFDIVNKQLKKRFADELKHRSIVADPDEEVEMTREELSALVKDAEIEGLEDFTPYTGLDYPAWMPGGMAVKAVDFLSRTVIGTGTVGGAGVHLHKDGSITAISPEDSPGYDHELHHEPGSEPIKRKRLPPVAKPATLEPEKELTGMEALLASRPKATARKDSNVHLSALLDQIYGEGQGQQLLG